ncbi:hypothetical protein SDD27957_08115 [Streptococcus dysgalactiae subsp. dysgalactiae ATCC 27957]|nr:hypothetical protein SDD27957_08115 [Streptococcus dysgalactiae subsp. dysgalactiae ATCC 27957]
MKPTINGIGINLEKSIRTSKKIASLVISMVTARFLSSYLIHKNKRTLMTMFSFTLNALAIVSPIERSDNITPFYPFSDFFSALQGQQGQS